MNCMKAVDRSKAIECFVRVVPGRVLQDRSGEVMSGGKITSNGARSKKVLRQSSTKTGRTRILEKR